MPPEALKQTSSNSSETYPVKWMPLIVPVLKKGWANYQLKLLPNQPAPNLKDWLALLHIAATNPNKVPAYLSQLLGPDSQSHWTTLTDLLTLTFEAARSEADKLTAEDWQTLVAIQNRIHSVAAQLADGTKDVSQPGAYERHLREQALIYDSIVTLGSGLDADTVLKLMSQKIAEAMRADACVISHIDADTQTVTALVEYPPQQSDKSNHDGRKLNTPIPFSQAPLVQKALATSNLIVSRAGSTDASDELIWKTIRADGESELERGFGPPPGSRTRSHWPGRDL